ncbi:heme-dependent oxidative N-demethylase family protein [Aliinostoc sp. HNIBRCY26]|uniref:heme-dependent oxidative N-demethylase family protein n=1 Tax=Aliinostoc sp. HNIBRCY26 TaxID=3418997 RepID=UPI003D036477
MQKVAALNSPPCYFPLMNGRYEVKPGMMAFGSCFGNGQTDQQVFQIDENFADYRQTKLLARAERLSKYYQSYNYSQTVAGAIARLIVERLTQEHPQYFDYQKSTANTFIFYSRLTNEKFYLDANWELQQVEASAVSPVYASTLDALAAQIQEDITVICCDNDRRNWLSAIHLCYPNHWSAEEKIGQDFAAIHTPVAGMEKINRRADAIVNTMIYRQPMVRFAWGLSTDTRLNHHPEPPPGLLVSQWEGRSFDPQNPKLYLRIERQVIWGLPESKTALFTIRTYFRDCTSLKQDAILRVKLCAAIESMSPEALIYKGLAASKASILRWLNTV